ncbi:MAG: S9 family peptidase [Candidatus Krumholzibacteriota bacterium]|nr:S9 family peptidase [Candidatus Krumholzibacteriota bacterium]
MKRSHVRVFFVLLGITLLIAGGISPAQKKPLSATDLWKMKRLSATSLSPDGKLAAVVVTSYDIEKNQGQGDIWIIHTDGSGERRFTTGETTEGSPVWSPCGKWLAFTAQREGEKTQLQLISLEGGEAMELTDMPLGVSDPRWMPDGRSIIFSSPVLPGYEGELDSLKTELERRRKSKVTAKVTEDRFYRYWDHWLTDGYLVHLFRIDIESREVTPLMPGWDRHSSTSGGIEYDISPDGSQIAFTSLREGAPYDKLESDIYLIDTGNPGKVKNLTADNPADDFAPYYTPDGKYILYGRQKILDFYGDRVRLVRYHRKTGEKKVITESFDHSPSGWIVDEKNKTVFFHAGDRAMVSLFSVPLQGGEVREIFRGGTNRLVGILPGGDLIFMHQSNCEPDRICVVGKNGKGLRKLTSFNDDILSGIEMGRFEDVWFQGAGGAAVQMFILYPPGFDAEKKWPLLVLVHGGPHGTFGDDFHPRWNTQVFAAPGYVTALVNFHGSSTFGQDFTDAITGENGRKPFIDVMRAVDHILERGFVDERRMAVAGGSYGGYLASWIGTQTIRFACLINHAGVFDLCAQFGSDITSGRQRAYGGTPWEALENVIRWSPAHNMENYVTPTLIIHGEKDYRVPVGNGLEAYGMLKAKGVPARFIYFPDENHWVLTAQNSIFWYREFHAWLERWIGVGPED